MPAHKGMTLWAISNRFKHKAPLKRECKARSRSEKCAGKILGTGYKVRGRWVCAYCARLEATRQGEE